ncbi:MAG: hypothetical protein A2722_02020 [Candidatus Doudnabacteria bacterium RIFCSPHIGHO2_01_FULL_50_11]|uniref:RNA polymerase sigma factor n=1 Tax=Candidatus Doudnabacteria bacterium RIFCSPHIGHO2_01_FULL_50_11 TaxID=1817828 RepID=A0A1F5PHH8_9BACT|nr:MAG: hypothetical protein A2722_02020 [Candidatus Doudnabacteria bacterium RIFCSPHIGHO2_01_FULL_50_11]HLC44327.1 RNA polymerase sigma factor [Patescibacteria group bacterium]
MDLKEKSIIERCQRGELIAFTEFYDGYVDRIYRYHFYRTRHQQLAEDLTQTTFLKALDAIASYDETKGALGPWLYRIARNSLFDHWRTAKETVDLRAAEHAASPQNIEREVQAKLSMEEVSRVIKQLPEDTRDLVLLRLWDGLSYSEIAQMLGRSEGSAKMAFGRAIKKIQTQLVSMVSIFLATIYVYGF